MDIWKGCDKISIESLFIDSLGIKGGITNFYTFKIVISSRYPKEHNSIQNPIIYHSISPPSSITREQVTTLMDNEMFGDFYEERFHATDRKLQPHPLSYNSLSHTHNLVRVTRFRQRDLFIFLFLSSQKLQ